MSGGSTTEVPRPHRWRAFVGTFVVLLVGVILTSATAISVRESARNDAEETFRQSAEQTAAAMRRELAAYFEKLRDIGAYQASAPTASNESFASFVEGTRIFEQLPSLIGVFFLERVEEPDVAARIAELEAGGAVITPLPGETPPGRAHYLLVRYVPGRIDLGLPVVTDVTPITTLVEVIEQAGSGGEGAAGSFQNDPLLQSIAEQTEFPLIDGLLDVDFFMGIPVFAPGASPDEGAKPLGWIGAPVADFDDVVGAVSAELPTGVGLELEIQLNTVSGVDQSSLSRGGQIEGTAGPKQDAAFSLPERFTLEGVDWQLVIWSPPDLGESGAPAQVVLAAGLVGSALAAGLLYLRQRVRDREREWAAELAAREAFQGQILDSVDTPMVVLDADGVVVRTNPAWRALVGSGLQPATSAPRDYLTMIHGFVRPDHEGLLAEGLRRVLRGETDSIEVDVAFDDAGRHRWHTIHITRLRGRSQGAVVVHTDITERKQSQDDLELRATTDDLTGLLNRVGLDSVMIDALDRASADGLHAGVIFIDLDGFKPINDTYGHSAGDLVLQVVAQRISGAVRTSDRVARLGGDEFVVLVSPLADPQLIEVTAQRILRSLAEPVPLDDARRTPVTVQASLGAAVTKGPNATTGDELISWADQAMYASKQSGGGRITLSV